MAINMYISAKEVLIVLYCSRNIITKGFSLGQFTIIWCRGDIRDGLKNLSDYINNSSNFSVPHPKKYA